MVKYNTGAVLSSVIHIHNNNNNNRLFVAPHLVRARSAYNNDNNEYLERLTRTDPKRLHVLYKSILSKFNAYNMNACTHRHTRTYTHTRTHTRTHAHTHKDVRIRLFHHTHARMHARALQIHALLVMGRYNKNKGNDKSVCRRKDVGFQF